MATQTIWYNGSITVYSSNNAGNITDHDINEHDEDVYKAYRTYNQGSSSVLITLPNDLLHNVRFSKVKVQATIGTPTRTAAAQGYYTASNIVEQLNDNGRITIPIYCYYQATSESHDWATSNVIDPFVTAGNKRHSLTFSNLKCEVTYTPTTNYSLDKTSVANGENVTLSLQFAPSVAVEANKLSAKIRPKNTTDYLMTFSNLNPTALSPNESYTITPKTVTSSVNSLYDDLELVIFNDTTPLEPVLSLDNFKFIATRAAPSVSNISGSGSKKIKFDKSTYLSSVNTPIFTCGAIQTDSNTDAYITQAYITFGNSAFADMQLDISQIQSTSETEWNLPPFQSSGNNVSYKLTIVDNYDKRAEITASDTIIVNQYQPLTISDDFTIQRYYINGLGDPEISNDGEWLVVNGSISYTDGLDSTPKISFKYYDANGVEQTIPPTDALHIYDHDYNIFKDGTTPITFSAKFDYTITVTVSDGYNTVIKEIEITKAKGYINIEHGGVAIGGLSCGSAEQPRFECYYPMYIVFGHYKYRIKLDTINDLRCLVVDTDSAEYIDEGHSQTEFAPYVLYDISAFSPEAGVDTNEAIRYIQSTDQTESGFYSVQWHYERDRNIYGHDYNECSPFLIQTAGMVIQKPVQNSTNTYGCIDTVETIRIPTNAKYLNFTVYHNYTSDGWFGYGIISPTSKMYNTFSEENKSHLEPTDIYYTSTIGRSDVTVQLDVSQADKTADWRIGVVFRSKNSSAYPELTIKKIWFSDN